MKKYSIYIFISVILSGSTLFAKDAQVRKIEESFLKEEFAESLSFCIAEGNASERARTLYLTGLNYMSVGSPCIARDFFRKAFNETTDRKMQEDTSLKIADAFYLEDNYAQALAVYKYFLEKFSDSSQRVTAFYKMGLCASKLGEWDELRGYLKEVRAQVQPSSLLQEKVDALQEKGFSFIIQAGVFMNKANALSLIKELQAKGHEASVLEEAFEKQTIYKVICGKYTSRDKAIQTASKLNADGYSTIIYP